MMFRQYWRDPGFWKWWWRNRVPVGARRAADAIVVLLLLCGGWIAADRLTAAGAETGADAYVLQTTVERIVTVRESGRLVRKPVPVVKRVLVRAPSGSRAQTQYQTQLVTVAGRLRVVRQPAVHDSRVHNRLVTVNGRTITIGETRLVPTTTVRMQTAIVTAERTVTDTQTRTDERTVTQSETRLRTITDTRTETSPPQTVTALVTSTETLPPDTVTVFVTVTVPKKP
jgi:hypothetical protein